MKEFAFFSVTTAIKKILAIYLLISYCCIQIGLTSLWCDATPTPTNKEENVSNTPSLASSYLINQRIYNKKEMSDDIKTG